MAAVQYLRAHDLLVAVGDHAYAGNAALNAGAELAELDDLPKAVDCFRLAARVFRHAGDENGYAKALRNIDRLT
ncbi:hypothetical protein ABZ816_26885 [Actinosynnema sp. NPDC047251]|uniref:Uncharacterized protein n=1 Tax=Saccharothrix espanaensis (strain ATCC 51144 / DSM 44229 / JCM 9112 / NBRC 15066 / NRRL 15764) TaxID=1179773 RepID=K0K600_SACES|nr:hypothetical protein [Saccharothrix espanaensis]CCH31983.1 hypothetical protein BN6_47040 [Saccharothrix espanaensis DSM 44229]